MRKTRDLFKKIRDTKGTFHAKMGLIKVRNGMDLTEAIDINDSSKTTLTANTIPPLHLDPTHKKPLYSQLCTSYVTGAKLNINLRRPICNKL